MSVRATVDDKVVGLTGSGSIDMATNAMKLTMTVQAAPSVPATTVSVISLDGTTYVSSPEISTLLPGKSWISQPSASATTSGVQGSTASGSLTNASDMLRLLAAKGAVITDEGSGTIGATPVTAYGVRISPAVIDSQISAVGIPSSDAATIHKIFDQGGLTFRVYISSANRIRRLSMSLELPAGSSSPPSHEVIVIDFTNYGTPVSITAPPPSQVATLPQLESAAGHSVS